MAIDLLKESGSLAETAASLSTQCGISKRQAYRYLKEAETAGQQIPIPDKKIAFTVKLSKNIVQQIRQHAKLKGKNLSEVVTEAVEIFLYQGRRRG